MLSMRRLWIIHPIVVLTLICVFGNLAAASPPVIPPQQHLQMVNSNFGDCIYFGTDVGIESLQLIKLGQCSILNNGNGTVTASGSTTTYYPVEYLSIRLYLQKWDGSQWVDLNTWLDEAYYADYKYGSHTCAVARGYYRTRARHYAVDGTLEEWADSYSSSIYVQ